MTATNLRSDWRSELQELIFAHSTDVMAGKSADETMRPVIELALKKLDCCLVHVWSVDPRREKLVLVAQGASRQFQAEVIDVLDVATSYTGIAFETRQPQVHTDLNGVDGRQFCNYELRDELGLKSFVSLPIRNIGNPHQVTIIINLYFDFVLPEVLKERPFANEFRSYSTVLATSFESNLRERAFRMSARVSQSLGRIERLTPESGCAAFARTVREAIDADWVTVLLENWNESAVVRQADDFRKGIKKVEEPSVPAEITNVWRNNREFLSPNVAADRDKAELVDSDETNIASAILVPLHDVRGSCKGVVRCVNFKRMDTVPWRRRHSYDDIAVVESMERAFAPPLDMLLESQMRDVSLRNLAHELRVPVVALRAVHERMEREYEDGKVWFKFRYPYFNEAHTFTSLMQRLLRQLEITRIGPDKIAMTRIRTRLLPDVIQPAIRFILPVLRQHRMGSHQIKHDGFEDVPWIKVDRELLTQLVFNLLDNMVKYFPKSRPGSEFEGRITCKKRIGSIEIAFSDNGPGISKLDIDRIFDFGYRSENADQSNVQGSGLGCWLAKEIARRHGGDLKVHSCLPFELVLKLPHPGIRTIEGL